MINTYSQVKKEINPQAENGLENGLVGYGVVIRTERFPVQTPLCARQGLGTHVTRLPVTFRSKMKKRSDSHRVSEVDPSIMAQS